MTREQKYPDTSTFHFHNQNPRNRYTEDCVVRALSLGTEIPYNDVVMELAKIACETGYSTCGDNCIIKFLERHGWTKCKQPRKYDNTKYTGREFCEVLQNATHIPFDMIKSATQPVIANIGGGHIVCIKNGKVWDTWNSTRGCIGFYFTK